MYRTADVIVVTPIVDGMNLVIKEAVICNPEASFVISSGAGAERQMFDEGLSHCYLRLDTVHDPDHFAQTLLKAIQLTESDRRNWGRILFDFTQKYDIDYWINSFISPEWTQAVVHPPSIIRYNT